MRKTLTYAIGALCLIAYMIPLVISAAVPTPAQAAVLAPQKALTMRITAYSSSVDETDSTPFITANGTHVHDGIVATNLLPFGTRVEIPALFGNKVFIVEDRMSPHFQNTIDIWMPSKSAALRFGVAHTDVVVLPKESLSLK